MGGPPSRSFHGDLRYRLNAASTTSEIVAPSRRARLRTCSSISRGSRTALWPGLVRGRRGRGARIASVFRRWACRRAMAMSSASRGTTGGFARPERVEPRGVARLPPPRSGRFLTTRPRLLILTPFYPGSRTENKRDTRRFRPGQEPGASHAPAREPDLARSRLPFRAAPANDKPAYWLPAPPPEKGWSKACCRSSM